MTAGFREDKVTFEIIETLGKIGEAKNGYQKEVAIVAWNHREPKIDIRSWDEAHLRMTKGITLTDEEAHELYEALKARYEK